MFTFAPNTCSRRGFLRVGGLGVASGLGLPQLLAAKALAGAGQDAGLIRDRCVILLFMHGGPSQIETFDPKMSAPSGVRSVTGEIATALPGVTFGSTFEKLAKLNDRFTIVRSFQTGDDIHDIKPAVGKHTLGAGMGSLYARVAGVTHPVRGMPRNIALFPRAVDSSAGPAIAQFGKFESTGTLGPAYAPFTPGDGAGGTLREDMRLRFSKDRLDDRKHLLGELDLLKRRFATLAEMGGTNKFQEQAFDTLAGGVSDAFDLSRERPDVLARYDTSRLMRKDQIDPRWKNREHYADHVATLGKLLLLARRLAERGAGFVTVTTSFVWDMHSDVNNATVAEGMRYVGAPFDHAVSAFIEDVEARGLRDKILLVCCGEMGRTPKVNTKGGRDHWGGLAPLLLYGGGLTMGAVVGESEADAGRPKSQAVGIPNLIATIMGSVFDLGVLRTVGGVPDDLMRAVSHEPIPGLA